MSHTPFLFHRAGLALTTLAVITLSAASLTAHDMWIDPTTFLPAAGEIVGVRLRVGQDLLGDPIPRDPSQIQQFVVDDAEGRKPVVGRAGGDPAGFVRASMPGMLVIGYRSNPASVELPADKFNQYSEGRRPRRGGSVEGEPQPDWRRRPRAVLAVRQEPGAVRGGQDRCR